MDGRTSVLTPGLREWLRGERDVNSAYERKIRSRIRKRVRVAFEDFVLLYAQLDEEDRTQIFGERNEVREPDDDLWNEAPELWAGAVYTVAFLYESLGERNPTDRPAHFTLLLQEAISDVLVGPRTVSYGPNPVRVEIDTSELVDLGPVGEKINSRGWGALSEDELEAIETMVNGPRGEALSGEFREYLLGMVDRIRSIKEGQQQAREEMFNELDIDPEQIDDSDE